MSEKVFPEGFFFKLPDPQAPSYVHGKMKIKLDEAIEYLHQQQDQGEEWLTLNLMESRNQKGYAEVDTWKPDPDKVSSQKANRESRTANQQKPPITGDDPDDTLPF